MKIILQVEPMGGNRLKLTFADGFPAIVDLTPLITKGIALELVAEERFAELQLNPVGELPGPMVLIFARNSCAHWPRNGRWQRNEGY